MSKMKIDGVNGFRKFNQKVLGHENASAFFQKKVTMEDTTLYFIDIFEYDFTDREEFPFKYKYQADAQFLKKGISYNISFDVKSLGDMENMMMEFFNKMGFEPDEY